MTQLITITTDGGNPVAHKARCRDLDRLGHRKGDHEATYEARSQTEVVTDYYQDQIGEGSMTVSDALANVRFFPCTNLPLISEWEIDQYPDLAAEVQAELHPEAESIPVAVTYHVPAGKFNSEDFIEGSSYEYTGVSGVAVAVVVEYGTLVGSKITLGTESWTLAELADISTFRSLSITQAG